MSGNQDLNIKSKFGNSSTKTYG